VNQRPEPTTSSRGPLVRRAGLLVVALAAAAAGGCYAVEESAEATVIRFSPVSRLAIVAVPACLVAAGLVLCLFKPTRIVGLLGVAGTLFLGGLILPGMYMDRVVITPTEITQTTGLWFAPTVKGFRYADVRSVAIRETQRGRHTSRVWFVQRRDGTTQEIDPGDLWEFNEALVVQKLRGYGVRFEE
jgi:hypothetical protein